MPNFLYLRLHMKSGKTHDVSVKILDDSSAETVWDEINEKLKSWDYFTTNTFWVRMSDVSFIEPHVGEGGL